MPRNQPIADLHVHLSLKPANNEQITNIWMYRSNPKPNKFLFFFNSIRRLGLDAFYKTYATYTQYNLESCVKGNVRLVCCSLYPIERPYINRRRFPTAMIGLFTLFTKTFPWFHLFNKRRNFLTALLRVIVGVSKTRAAYFWNEQRSKQGYIDYFTDYQREAAYLSNPVYTTPGDENYQEYSFQLVNSYTEYAQFNGNPKVICGILSLEGMHGLTRYKVQQLFGSKMIHQLKESDRKALEQSFITNIRHIKNNPKLRPFFITYAHHYNNLLCGHSTSFSGGLSLFFNQKGGRDKDLTDFGMTLITDHLLTRNNGPRILIDIKHMSVKARRSYYQIVEAQRQLGDAIPIISSHSAVNGIQSLAIAERQKSTKKLNKHSYISRWNINLTNEDILQIYASKGLIGILTHDGRMPGKLFADAMQNTQNSEEKNLLHIQLFLSHVYHIIKVVYEQQQGNAWSMLTLGTDMDGIIDPFDNYDTAALMPAFQQDMQQYLESYALLPDRFKIKNLYDTDHDVYSPKELLELNQSLTPKTIVRQLFYENFDRFLRNYFTEEYLSGSQEPVLA